MIFVLGSFIYSSIGEAKSIAASRRIQTHDEILKSLIFKPKDLHSNSIIDIELSISPSIYNCVIFSDTPKSMSH